MKRRYAIREAAIEVDGQPIVELGFEGAVQRIRGPVGTVVLLRVRKAASGESIDLPVTRRKIRA